MSIPIKQHRGDIFNSKNFGDPNELHVILHQCNAQGVMGSGIAKTVRNKFPSTYVAYMTEIENAPTLQQRLGSISFSLENIETSEVLIINLIGQANYGSDGAKYTSYDALDSALQKVDDLFSPADTTVNFHFPKIGSVRGGGDWLVIEQIIKSRLNKDHYKLNLWEL